MRLGVFADVQNIYYTCRDVYGRSFNYRLLWQQLSGVGDIYLANAYAIERNDPQQQKFQTALRHIGFEVKLKPYVQRQDGSAKGDWDVGITIDVLAAAAELDRLILLSGDGDFSLLLDAVREQHGLESYVYAVPGLTALALQRSATVYQPITEALLC